MPRNSFVGLPLHRVDLRLEKSVRLFKRSMDGIMELFSVLNHKNFGSYTTTENASDFGKPQLNPNVAYNPRSLQLGFRLTF